MRRRVVVGIGRAAAVGCALPGCAQPAARVYRIGALSETLPPDVMVGSIKDRLKPFGYEGGRNFVNSADLDAALAAMTRDRPQGVVVSMTGPMISNEARIMEFMARTRIPALYTTPRPARVGGLISFCADFVSIRDRNAWIVDKILKSAKPRDIPVEEPTKFDLKISLKTARAMGLTFPRELLARADEVIE